MVCTIIVFPFSAGREYRAIFICTSEPVKPGCKSYDPVRSLCDQYVFNTVITRACSLVVAIGNPFRLMKIEEQAQVDDSKTCWLPYLYRCLQCQSLTLSSVLNEKRVKVDHKEIEEGQKALDKIMFTKATEQLKIQSELPNKTHDTIVDKYNNHFEEKNMGVTLERVGGDIAWKLGKDQPVITRPQEKPRETVKCHLQQKSVRECVAIPVEPREKPFVILGIENRRCAFEGALVQVEPRGHDSHHRYGRVYSVIEQDVQPLICEVDPMNASVFVPVDQKSPQLFNLPHVPRQFLNKPSHLLDNPNRKLKQLTDNQKRRKGYVFCFKSDTLGLNVPKVSDLVPLEVAPLLLFVVHPVCWTLQHRYPLGAVIGMLPKGTSPLYAKKILSIQHLVPDVDDPDSEVTFEGVAQPWVEIPPTCINTVGILSRGGHCSLALSVEEEKDGYKVGVHVCNVADSVAHSQEFRDNKFVRWTGIFAQCQGKTVYHSVLPADVIKDHNFDTNCVRSALTLDILVEAGLEFQELVNSWNAVRFPVENLQVREVKWNPASAVQCDLILEMAELEEILKALMNGKERVCRKLIKKIEHSGLTHDAVFKIVSVLYVVADELCFKRQGHRGYSELTQEWVYGTSADSFEASRVVHELVTFANHEAAKRIGQALHNKMLLKVQWAPPEENLQAISNVFPKLLSMAPYFQWLERRQADEAVKAADPKQTMHADSDITGSDGEESAHKETKCVLLRTLAAELKQYSTELDFHTARRLFFQLRNHPELGVLEARIADALPKEEVVVQELTSKTKTWENPELKHHSLQLAVSPYTFLFDSIPDIYVQHMLLSALRQQVEDVASADALGEVARLSNRAVTNARSYESSMTALDVAMYAQHSSICVEAYVKAVSEGDMHLCYADHALQKLQSVQVIRLSLVTRSSAVKKHKYSAKITSLGDNCRVLTKPTYEIKRDPRPDRPDLVVFYPEIRNLLIQHELHVEYPKATLCVTQENWQKARMLLEKPCNSTVKDLVATVKEEREVMYKTPSKLPKGFDKAPLLTLSVPFTFKPGQVVKMWLRTDTTNYILTPRPQLIELNPDVRICLQHSEDAQSCFTQGAAAAHTKPKYSSIDRYVKTWEELVLAEAADASVQEAQHMVFTDFPLKFSDFQVPENCIGEEFYEPVGVFADLPKEFLKNRQDLFPFACGHFVCARYCINLQREPNLLYKYQHCLYPAADNCVRCVLHLVVDGIYRVQDGQMDEVDDVDEVIKTDLKVCIACCPIAKLCLRKMCSLPQASSSP